MTRRRRNPKAPRERLTERDREQATIERRQLYFKPAPNRIPYAGKDSNAEKMS